jgi:hypothetical protein
MLFGRSAAGSTARPSRICGERTPMLVETKGILRGVVDDLVRGEPVPRIAAKFHATLGRIVGEACERIRELTGLRRVALSGGVFQNVRLLTEVIANLQASGFEVYRHSPVPPNDGGISLGQRDPGREALRRRTGGVLSDSGKNSGDLRRKGAADGQAGFRRDRPQVLPAVHP